MPNNNCFFNAPQKRGRPKKYSCEENKQIKKSKTDAQPVDSSTSIDLNSPHQQRVYFLTQVLQYQLHYPSATQKQTIYFLQHLLKTQRAFFPDFELTSKPTDKKKIWQIEIRSTQQQEIPIVNLLLNSNTLLIQSIQLSDAWHVHHINELIRMMNLLLKVKICLVPDVNLSGLTIQEDGDPQTPLNWLENIRKNEFIDFSNRYQDSYYVVPNFMLYHTAKANNENICWISWPPYPQPKIKGHEDLALELNFNYFTFAETTEQRGAQRYYSWLFNEADFLKLHSYTISPGYYRLRVYECTHDQARTKKDSPLLDLWFSADSRFGELRDLKKGNALSGTEGMKVFDYVNQLLGIKHIYLCDSSRKTDDHERSENQIVFRVLMSVAYGKTWYEKLGYEAFSFKHFTPGWLRPKEAKTTPFISQNVEEYEQARTLLRYMPINELYYYFLANEKEEPSKAEEITTEKRSHLLNSLCQTFYGAAAMMCHTTLGTLIATVYEQFKINKNSATEANLQKAYRLLILPEKYLSIANDEAKQCTMPLYDKALSTLIFTRFFRKQEKIEQGQPAIETSTIQCTQWRQLKLVN